MFRKQLSRERLRWAAENVIVSNTLTMWKDIGEIFNDFM